MRAQNLSPERTDDGLRVRRAIGASQGLGARDVPGLASDGKHPYVFFIEERSLLVRLILLRRRVPGVLEVATPELDGMTGLLRGDIDPRLGDDRVLICSNDHDAILRGRVDEGTTGLADFESGTDASPAELSRTASAGTIAVISWFAFHLNDDVRRPSDRRS
jgi:hypothetical protein